MVYVTGWSAVPFLEGPSLDLLLVHPIRSFCVVPPEHSDLAATDSIDSHGADSGTVDSEHGSRSPECSSWPAPDVSTFALESDARHNVLCGSGGIQLLAEWRSTGASCRSHERRPCGAPESVFGYRLRRLVGPNGRGFRVREHMVDRKTIMKSRSEGLCGHSKNSTLRGALHCHRRRRIEISGSAEHSLNSLRKQFVNER